MKKHITLLLLPGLIGCTRPLQSDTNCGGLTCDDVYRWREHEERPLHVAAILGDHARIKLFLAEGAELEARTSYGATPLTLALVHAGNNKRTFDLLVASGADIRTLDNSKSSLLHAAAAHGRLDIAKFLLAQKLDVNARDSYGRTPLNRAVISARLPLARLLVNHGAEVDAMNAGGKTPLHQGVGLACLYAYEPGNSYLDVLEFILSKGANVHARTTKDPRGASVGVPSRIKAGDTPLAIALRYPTNRHKDVVSLLQKYGATH